MNIIHRCLIISTVNNLVISIIKIVGGLIFNLSSLFADGLHTFSDFTTDVVSLISSKYSRKRANKRHPFGYGMVEFLSNLFIGVLIFLLGVYIFIESFSKNYMIPNISVIFLLVIVIIIKFISIYILYKNGKKISSQTLLVSSKESLIDLYSTLAVVIITILLQFSDKIEIFKYSDIAGSILISLLIFKTGFDIIRNNFCYLIGENDIDSNKRDKIKKVIEQFSDATLVKVELIKYGPYYLVDLQISLDPAMSLKKLSKVEDTITKQIKNLKLGIKYVNIDSHPEINK